MIDVGILAEITNKWAFSGIWSLTLIPVLIVIILAYSSGQWGGSCTCAFFFLIAAIFTTDSSSTSNLRGENMFITNRAQTKWLEQSEFNPDERGCIYINEEFSNGTRLHVYVPAKELYVDKEGWKRLKTTGERATDDDYYLLDEPIARANVPKEDGGWGIPQWIYHPAALIWPFMIAGAPSILIGGFVMTKVRG